jgi:hypothetical protein
MAAISRGQIALAGLGSAAATAQDEILPEHHERRTSPPPVRLSSTILYEPFGVLGSVSNRGRLRAA